MQFYRRLPDKCILDLVSNPERSNLKGYSTRISRFKIYTLFIARIKFFFFSDFSLSLPPFPLDNFNRWSIRRIRFISISIPYPTIPFFFSSPLSCLLIKRFWGGRLKYSMKSSPFALGPSNPLSKLRHHGDSSFSMCTFVSYYLYEFYCTISLGSRILRRFIS